MKSWKATSLGVWVDTFGVTEISSEPGIALQHFEQDSHSRKKGVLAVTVHPPGFKLSPGPAAALANPLPPVAHLASRVWGAGLDQMLVQTNW